MALFDDRVEGHPITGLAIGIWFQMTSTRTRTAFTVATLKLGGHPVTFGPKELQTATGETELDTARVLGSMLDGVVIRTPGSSINLATLQYAANIPVINAMASDEHPTQAITDLATLRLHLGDLSGRSVVYVGEGNNSAAALVRAVAKTPGLSLRLITPEGYGLPIGLIADSDQSARPAGGAIIQDHDIDNVDPFVDAVYTTRWQTTGTRKSDSDWYQAFEPYRIDSALMARMPRALFMHDLPAYRGDEVTGDVLDGPRSVAWDQARMKLFTAMAILEQTFWRHGEPIDR